MKKIFYIILLAAFVIACSKDEIETWDAKPCVWFTNSGDTLLFSFYSLPAEAADAIVEIPISMAGTVDTADREVAVRDLGCRNSATQYEIVSAVIPGGETSGTLAVRVHKTDNLSIANDTIGFEIIDSDVFAVGLGDYLTNALVVSNMLGRPEWWVSRAENYLGQYSDEKLAIIYTCGYYELFNSVSNWWSPGDDVTIAIYQLNQYCKEHNSTYPSGEEIRFDYGSIYK